MLAAAAQDHSAGRLAEADAGYRQVLERFPDHPDALHLLGLLAIQTGQFEAAAELIGKAILARPSDPEYYINRCEAYRGMGRIEDALADCQKALDLNPDDPGALYAKGVLLLSLDERGDAIDHFRRALDQEPDFVEAQNSLAVVLLEEDRVDEAVAYLRRAVTVVPEFAEAHGNLAAALLRQDRVEDAEASFRQALELDPDFGEALFNYGRLLRVQGRFIAAAEKLDRALQLEPNNVEIAMELGGTLTDLGDRQNAEKLFRKLLAVRPDDPEILHWMGICREAQGDFGEARTYFERALASKPDHVYARFHLATLNKGKAEDSDIAHLEELAAREDLPAADRATALYGLGDIHDARHEFDKAFASYEAANQVMGGAEVFELDKRTAYVEQLKRVYGPELFAAKADIGDESTLPIFVLGMPRSGTTLVEQILASHPQVEGAGELREMGYIVQNLPQLVGGDLPYPDCIAALDRATAQEIANAYLAQLRECSADALRVTDKLPNNFQRIGLIHLLFPNARIIHCKRDRLSTCWSCFVQNFGDGQVFSYDLGNVGRYYRLYEDLMNHWHTVLPGLILDVKYEDVVANLERESRRIIAHCGLDWDPRCLDFHMTERPVVTASYQQVRQPIYTSSLDRWRAYERYLDPLKEALGL